MTKTPDISSIRREYHGRALTKHGMLENPLEQFHHWFQAALQHEQITMPNAMAVSTVSQANQPSSRIILLKHYDEHGFTFYTNYNSHKSKDINKNPQIALLFWWQLLYQQVRIEGVASKISAEQSDAYFQSRPRGSQLGAVASPQSKIIPDRNFLQQGYDQLEKKYKNKNIQRPECWGGYIVKPHLFEFWQGRENRLHDRFQYRLEKEKWVLDRLAP